SHDVPPTNTDQATKKGQHQITPIHFTIRQSSHLSSEDEFKFLEYEDIQVVLNSNAITDIFGKTFQHSFSTDTAQLELELAAIVMNEEVTAPLHQSDAFELNK
ncbi:unnamed protein product, partial [Didymodactylos carnosus]